MRDRVRRSGSERHHRFMKDQTVSSGGLCEPGRWIWSTGGRSDDHMRPRIASRQSHKSQHGSAGWPRSLRKDHQRAICKPAWRPIFPPPRHGAKQFDGNGHPPTHSRFSREHAREVVVIPRSPAAEIERAGRTVPRALEHLREILQLGFESFRASATAPSLPHFHPTIADKLEINQRAAQARLEKGV